MKRVRGAGGVLFVALALSVVPAEPVGADEQAEPEDLWPVLEQRLVAVRALLAGDLPGPGRASEPWVQASEHSALVYWQTEGPSRTFVEYGLTSAYGRRTDTSDVSQVTGWPTWSHFHRLRGLEPGTTYHYRRVTVDADGQETAGPDETLRTEARKLLARIPGDVAGPPYVLNTPGLTYLVTEDIAAPGVAFRIVAGDVTLDLGGHTVVYNAEPAGWEGDPSGADRVEAVCGVHVHRKVRRPFRVLNGTLVQGAGNDAAASDGRGANPIYVTRVAEGAELAGLTVRWSGDGVSGIFLHWGGGARVHHCVLEDRGTVIPNRHLAVRAVDGSGLHHFAHNLVKRTRQQGLRGALTAYHNEVYVDSHATNSFGIHMASSRTPSEVAHNRVFGKGQHPIGYGMYGPFAAGSRLHHNLAIVECTRRGEEYGWTGSAALRTTWGTHHLDVTDNVFVGSCHTRERGRNGVTGQTRVVWIGLPEVKNARGEWEGTRLAPEEVRGIVRRNVVLARGLDPTARAGALCVVCKHRSPHLVFLDNLVLSSYGTVVLSDNYGSSEAHAKFTGNVFRRIGAQPGFHTIRSDRARAPAKATFLSNRFEEGASPDDVRVTEKLHVVSQRRLEVRVMDGEGRPVGGAAVEIRDAAGSLVFEGTTASQSEDAMLLTDDGIGFVYGAPVGPHDVRYVEPTVVPPGAVRAVVTAAERTQAGHQEHGPFRVRVVLGDREATVEVALEEDGRLDVEL